MRGRCSPNITSVLMSHSGGSTWRGEEAELDSLPKPSRNVCVNLQSAVKARCSKTAADAKRLQGNAPLLVLIGQISTSLSLSLSWSPS